VQLAYEYGYGFDGGRRWRKDYVNGVWTRYPCGVACGAGELVEQTSDLSGSQWTTSALYLQGISLVRRNNEWHHFDPLGTAQVITNSSAQVVSNNVYDLFGVLRYQQGSAQTPWRMRDCRHVARGPGICQPLCLTLAPQPLKPFCGLIGEAASLSAGVLCGLGCRAIYGKMLDECQRQYEECMRRSKMPMLRLASASPSFQ